MTIEVRNIVKKFGSFAALDDVDLKVATGELVALLGPSGSGKTSLLRIIAGLDWPDSGLVSFDGENALERGAGERHVGFVDERMMAGDERYLLPRDRGKVRAYVRDLVDSRRNVAGILLPIAVLSFVILLVPFQVVQAYGPLVLLVAIGPPSSTRSSSAARSPRRSRPSSPRRQLRAVDQGLLAGLLRLQPGLPDPPLARAASAGRHRRPDRLTRVRRGRSPTSGRPERGRGHPPVLRRRRPPQAAAREAVAPAGGVRPARPAVRARCPVQRDRGRTGN